MGVGPRPSVAEKPAILQDSRFIVEEGLAYRAARTGAIWMNKLFFSSLVLLGIWLLLGALGGVSACVDGVPAAPADPATVADEGLAPHCNVFLTPTSLYLGAMSLVSFLLSIAFGVLGLIFGKRIVESTPAALEVGARTGQAGTGGHGAAEQEQATDGARNGPSPPGP